MSHFPIFENSKTALRKSALEIREGLAITDISRQIRERIESWPLFQKTETVLLYSPFRNEIDLMPLIEQYPKKRWYLPKIKQTVKPQEEPKNLVFCRYLPFQPLIPGAYGILESASEEVLRFPLSTPPLIFVPGLMFDRKGYRLGYGKGYYDRFFKRLEATGTEVIPVGAVAEALCIDSLPRESHDMPVSWLVTEAALYAVNRNA